MSIERKEKLIQQLLANEIDIHEVISELRTCGLLTNRSLSGINLENAKLALANLSEAIIPRANFRQADLDLADLTRADLSGSNFMGANLMATDFTDANLRFANFQETELFGPARFWRADMTGANLYKAQMSEVLLADADLTEANLAEVQFLNETELMRVNALHLSILANGERYDGRYRLDGDILNATNSQFNVQSAQDMSQYYGVTIKQYLAGQKWANDNIGRV